MQLEETIAKELAGIIKEHTGTFVDQIRAIEKAIDLRLAAIEAIEPKSDDAPADVIDEIAKAVALLAEAPPLTQGSSGNPVVVNFSPPNTGKKIKTITTRRDEAGNLVARVIED